MIKRQALIFLARWAASTFGMWICINVFATITAPYNIGLFILAGLIFSLINSFVKPMILALTTHLFILLMGLFMIIVNVFITFITILILPNVEMGVGGILISSLIMSTIIFLVNFAVLSYNK